MIPSLPLPTYLTQRQETFRCVTHQQPTPLSGPFSWTGTNTDAGQDT